MKYQSIQFIGEPIKANFDNPPMLEKRPGCPDGFSWRGELFKIREVISEWQDYKRRGRMARNMLPEHASTAERRGSWGVGEFYFRVRTEQERIFDIYYDRSPKNVNHRKGECFIFRELSETKLHNNNQNV